MKVQEYDKHMDDIGKTTDAYKAGLISLIEALQRIKAIREEFAYWDRDIEKIFARNLINAK